MATRNSIASMNIGSNLALGSQYSREGLNTGRSDGMNTGRTQGLMSPVAHRGLYPSIPEIGEDKASCATVV